MLALPKIGAIFITYNQEGYVAEALRSLFNQTYPHFEIIISDDCSTDGTYVILQKMVSEYQGPHKLVLNRTSKNVGIGRNTQVAINLTDADIYITCDGDDISKSDRVEKIVDFFKSQNSQVNLLVSDAFSMAEDGTILDIKKSDDLQLISSVNDLLKKSPLFFGATTAFRKNLITDFEEITEGVSAIDQIILARSILSGAAFTLHEPLVYHRVGGITGFHSKNVYQKISRLKRDSLRTIADISQKLKDSKVKNISHLFEAKFSKDLAIAKYIQDLFGVTSNTEKLKIFFRNDGVPVVKKIRFFLYATVAPLLNIFWVLKSKAGR